MNNFIVFLTAIIVTASVSAQAISLQACSSLIAQELNSSDIEATAESLLVLPNAIVRNENQIQYLCENDAAVMGSVNIVPRPSGPLTIAEKIAIAKYTIDGRMTQLIGESAHFIEPVTGLYYRGSQSARLKNSKVGDIISFDRTTSVSKSKKVAIGFMAEQDSQLLTIKAKSARPIESLSQNKPDGISEEEALILAGTKIKIIRVSTKKITANFGGEKKVILNAKVIEAEEID